MSFGLRLRDPSTGVARLDTTDYTVSVIDMLQVTISGAGAMSVPGISPDVNGAFLIPAFQFATRLYGDRSFYPEGDSADFWSKIWPFQPRVYIEEGVVRWDSEAGSDWRETTWWLIVVRFS